MLIETRTVLIEPPDGLLQCQAEPRVPAPDQLDAGPDFVLDLAAAGQDCRSRLASLRGFIAAAKARLQAMTP